MAMVVKNNTQALNTLNTLNKNTSALSKSLAKVSSGMRINSASDDASGYAISERMRVQIRSLEQDQANAKNGASMLTVAEGAISNTVEILKTMKEKAINAANDTNTDADRATIQKELDQSIDQINDNANVTFNGQYLIDGSKNRRTTATSTTLTNQSLSTATTASTEFTELCARNGDSLGILSTDTITVSFVRMGITSTTSFTVGDKNWDDVVNILNATDEASKQQAMDEALKDENGSKYNTAINELKEAIAATNAYNAAVDAKNKAEAAATEISDFLKFVTQTAAGMDYSDQVTTTMLGNMPPGCIYNGMNAISGSTSAVATALTTVYNAAVAASGSGYTGADFYNAAFTALKKVVSASSEVSSKGDVASLLNTTTTDAVSLFGLVNNANTAAAPVPGTISTDPTAKDNEQAEAIAAYSDAGLGSLSPTTNVATLEAALATAQAAFDNVYKDKLDGLGTFRQIRAENTTDFIGLDGSGNSVYTASGENALTLRAAQSGLVG